MDFGRTQEQESIRSAVRSLCAQFPNEYWRELDGASEYPEKFIRALTDAGWLAALIPNEFGGAGLGLAEAALIIEEVNASGGNAAVRSGGTFRGSRRASCGSRRSASPSRRRGRRRRASRRPRCIAATAG